MNRLYILIFSIFFLSNITAQNCKIKCDTIVCLGNSLILEADSLTNNPLSYSWQFGDATSSSLSKPSHLYTQPGNYQVKLTLTFLNNKTCDAIINVRVYAIPTSYFAISKSSNFCFSNNQVCIIDSSKVSSDQIPIAKRIILWGDGSASIDSNFTNKIICHTYKNWGDFVIDMEITDYKACNKKYSQHIYIKPPLKAYFFIDTLQSNCDTLLFSFTADTKGNGSKVSYSWRFYSDNTTATGVNVKKIYTQNGFEWVTLIAKDTSGCTDSLTLKVPLNIVKPQPIKYYPIRKCATDNLYKFERPKYPNLISYKFIIYDEHMQKPGVETWTNDSLFDYLSLGLCGKYYIYVKVIFNNCQKIYLADSIDILGPQLDLKVFNTNQCNANDKPVLFCENLCTYKSNHLKRIYNFDDGTYSSQANPQHVYSKSGCYEPKLIVIDTVNGCSDTAIYKVTISKVNVKEDSISGRKGIVMTPSSYFECFNQTICFDYSQILPTKPCKPWHSWMIFDSAAPNAYWVRDDTLAQRGIWDSTQYKFCYTYYESFDTNGFVTVGYIAANGYDQYNFSCDSIIKQKNLCYDTTWLHFRLSGTNAKFTYTQDNKCNPVWVTVTPKDSMQDSIAYSIWEFGKDTIIIDTIFNNGVIPSRKHLFTNGGYHRVRHTVINNRGCKSTYTDYIYTKHFADFTFDTMVCAGTAVKFYDSVFYYEQLQLISNKLYVDTLWHLAGRPEKMYWDFGDGTVDSIFNPIHNYSKPGLYTIKLITIDSMGCIDTCIKYKALHVIQLKANFNTDKEKYLCGEYVQFLDSSYFIVDSMIQKSGFVKPFNSYLWTWGDGKRSSILQDPYHNFTSFGWISVKEYVENTWGCKDSITKQIYIQGPVSSFEIVSDSAGCVPFTVHLKNTSLDTTCSSYIWMMGDSAKTIISHTTNDSVVFTYSKPGIYEIYLIGQDSVYNPATGNKYFCNSVFPDTNIPPGYRKRVIVQPFPPVKLICPDTVCPSVLFDIIDSSDAMYTFYHTTFGDGFDDTYITKKYSHSYSKSGLYTILHEPDYTPTFPYKRCVNSLQKTIRVIDIHADFDTNVISKNNGYNFGFTNKSINAFSYLWDFGHPQSGKNNSSTEVNPTHNFGGDSGWYHVCLYAFSKEGCIDTACKDIYNPTTRKLIIPNVYTNDGDSINDAFDILIVGEDYYKLYIYTQWGELVFVGESDGEGNDGQNWNGHSFNTGKENPTGTYYFIFDYKFIGDENIDRVKGVVTLLRENK